MITDIFEEINFLRFYDSLTIQDGNSDLEMYCGKIVPSKQIVLSSNVGFLRFHSSLRGSGTNRGFKLEYEPYGKID